MSAVNCWQCGEVCGKDEVLDIPIFHKGFRFQWCLNCVKKQLRWTEYKLVKR